MKNILIDLDNTMVVCNIYYQFVKTNLVKYLHKITNASEEDIFKKLEDFELERLNNIDAFASNTFIEVFQKTAMYFGVNVPIDSDGYCQIIDGEMYNSRFIAKEIPKIKQLAQGVYDNAPYTVYPKVNDTLLELDRRGYNMYIVTKGSFYCQLRKVQDLSKVFKGVFILPNKNSEVYEGIIKTIGAVASETWMVGDSPTDDIVEASKAGLKTVWVRRKAKTSWVGDPYLADFKSTLTIESFDGLLDIF
jgi:FMN phosphatase YigB (HAD superfamily)